MGQELVFKATGSLHVPKDSGSKDAPEKGELKEIKQSGLGISKLRNLSMSLRQVSSPSSSPFADPCCSLFPPFREYWEY